MACDVCESFCEGRCLGVDTCLCSDLCFGMLFSVFPFSFGLALLLLQASRWGWLVGGLVQKAWMTYHERAHDRSLCPRSWKVKSGLQKGNIKNYRGEADLSCCHYHWMILQASLFRFPVQGTAVCLGVERTNCGFGFYFDLGCGLGICFDLDGGLSKWSG